ncbi:MAG: hypothetical protein OXG98_13800 [Gemmatimonadetes bacterium]|nr:hypothetical protein [Gemmatimonadota bacterium]
MSEYVRTDERQDVLASLQHCLLCLAETERSSGAWKWVILSLHSALQGAMVCLLSGTANLGALSRDCASKWIEWHERDRRGEIDYIDDVDEFSLPFSRPRNPRDYPPSIQVASAPKLFERLGSESARTESGCVRIIEITNAQKHSFKRLHALRNDFTHFSPKGWSIEIQLIQEIILDMLDVIDQIADDQWAFLHMSDEDQRLMRNAIADLRRRFRDLSANESEA